MTLKTVAFIPARAGSKGIPEKNVKHFSGKPLIALSIEQALNANLVHDVFVSTDCENIARIAESYGAKVPFLRPARYSTDESPTEAAMLHFCEYLKLNNANYDNFLLLQPTSPIRGPERIDDALSVFNESSYDSMLSVSNSHRFFWRDLQNPEASYDFLKRPRRQDIRKEDAQYVETGSFYITKISTLVEVKNRLGGNVGLYVTPVEESYEIDSPLDFEICERIHQFQNKKFANQETKASNG